MYAPADVVAEEVPAGVGFGVAKNINVITCNKSPKEFQFQVMFSSCEKTLMFCNTIQMVMAPLFSQYITLLNWET